MKYFTFPFILIAILNLPLSIYSQPVNWVQKIDSDISEGISDIAAHPDGSMIVSGFFTPKSGIRMESRDGNHITKEEKDMNYIYGWGSAFLSQYDTLGNVQWMLNLEAEKGIHIWDTHVDNKGDIIITGNYRGKAIFHSIGGKTDTIPGLISEEYRRKMPLSSFIAKYDSKGKLKWIRKALSRDNSVFFEAQTDAENNIYVRAHCHSSTIAFDQHIILPQSITYLHFIFIKYSPEGDEEWVFYGGKGNASPKDMTVDEKGNISIRILHFKSIELKNTLGQEFDLKDESDEMFRRIFTINTHGELTGVRDFVPKLETGRIYKRKHDNQGNTYCIIKSWKNYSSIPQTNRLVLNGKEYKARDYDFYLTKFNVKEELEWISEISSPNKDLPGELEIDSSGNIWISGSYWKDLEILDGKGKKTELKNDLRGYFIASYSPSGEILSTQNMGGFHVKDFDHTLRMEVATGGLLFCGGGIDVPSKIGDRKLKIKGKTWHPNLDEEKSNHFYGHPDAFISSIRTHKKPDEQPPVIAISNDTTIQTTVAIQQQQIFNNGNPIAQQQSENHPYIKSTLFPNPVDKYKKEVHVQLEGTGTHTIQWQLLDVKGALIFNKMDSEISFPHTTTFDLSKYPSGLYFLIIKSQKFSEAKRIVIP